MLRAPLHKDERLTHMRRRVVVRLLAGVAVIGLLLWGLSTLATPERDEPTRAPRASAPPEPPIATTPEPTTTPAPDADEPAPAPAAEKRGSHKGRGSDHEDDKDELDEIDDD